MSAPPPSASLLALARTLGALPSYFDVSGKRVLAAEEDLVPILRALGAEIETPEDAPEALRAARDARRRRACEPVRVVAPGKNPRVAIRVPGALAGARAAAVLTLEGGERREFPIRLEVSEGARDPEAGGEPSVFARLTLPIALPYGYHRLAIEAPGLACETLLLAPPPACPVLPDRGGARPWGVFLPLHALWSGRSGPLGDLTDLENLVRWSADRGASVVGILPPFAAFLGEPFDPSPYSPVSRRFWNEVFLDTGRAPFSSSDAPGDAPAPAPDDDPSFRLADFRRASALREPAIRELARALFEEDSERARGFRSHLAGRPLLTEYARFRAAGDRFRAPWGAWPARARDGAIATADFDPGDERRHLAAQWAASRQWESVARAAREAGSAIYLDMPLGVNPSGFDVWRERGVFANGASVGAPPDVFIDEGQNWGFPPLHPERLRETGYRYPIECLRHALGVARVLRVDHVMALHRLFWIPGGRPAKSGVYVRYRAEEMHAVLAIEAQRAGAMIVGEDLGTVPDEVRLAMKERKLQRMFVLQFELPSDARAVAEPPEDSLASLNTHDMPPFASFWRGNDIDDRVGLGWLDEAGAAEARAARAALRAAVIARLDPRGERGLAPHDPAGVIAACLEDLGAGRARTLLVNLEDLWLEVEPQNVPGTSEEMPNWTRRARLSFEALTTDGRVRDVLARVHRSRRIRSAGEGAGADAPREAFPRPTPSPRIE